MIPKVAWRNPQLESANPFQRGKDERTLRITFHDESFTDVPDNEALALELLRGLCTLPELRAYQTGKGPFPQVQIEYETNATDEFANVTLYSVDGEFMSLSWVSHVHQHRQSIASQIAKPVDDPTIGAILSDIVLARAQIDIGQDILVTLSPNLINDRKPGTWLGETNARTPVETAQIVGLFLRSRDIYHFWPENKYRLGSSPRAFYWTLMRHRLPAMWRYYSACVEVGIDRTNDTMHLGSSLLDRCMSALKARDEIGKMFYLAPSSETEDTMRYHFNYLLLLLIGALDAQGIITGRSYFGINSPSHTDRKADFGKDFLKDLKNFGGSAAQIAELINTKYASLLALVKELRNTIHKAGPPTTTAQEERVETSRIEVLEAYKVNVLRDAHASGTLDEWGIWQSLIHDVHLHVTGRNPIILTNQQDLWIEPYTFATKVIKEWFGMLDEIASLTEFNGLFPSGIPPLMTTPSTDGWFHPVNVAYINLLG